MLSNKCLFKDLQARTHSSMNDQQVIDAYHPDLRRTRAASQSIIPVDTKLAVGIERILPKFAGKFVAYYAWTSIEWKAAAHATCFGK